MSTHRNFENMFRHVDYKNNKIQTIFIFKNRKFEFLWFDMSTHQNFEKYDSTCRLIVISKNMFRYVDSLKKETKSFDMSNHKISKIKKQTKNVSTCRIIKTHNIFENQNIKKCFNMSIHKISTKSVTFFENKSRITGPR